MKFMTFLAAGLLPMIALAVPVADASPVAIGEANTIRAVDAVEMAEPDVPPTSPVDARDLFKRATQYCRITGNDGSVNCRSGPGTSYSVRYTMAPGGGYYFSCYKRGTNVGGNTYVDDAQHKLLLNCMNVDYYAVAPGIIARPTNATYRDSTLTGIAPPSQRGAPSRRMLKAFLEISRYCSHIPGYTQVRLMVQADAEALADLG
ncbi:MAG: hypothetical protein Q9216_003588 [Gyalolechia sp. 2 TL-2023]